MEYPHNHFLDREWLHIHVLDGSLYVFADDGHWDHQPDWQQSNEVIFKQLEEDCFLGIVENGEHMFRIRMNPPAPKLITTKFGIQYWKLHEC